MNESEKKNKKTENELNENELDDVSGGVKTATVCSICGSRKGPFHGTYCSDCYKKRLKHKQNLV